MQGALYKYKTLMAKGEWEAPDSQQQQILALTAVVKTLKEKDQGRGKRPEKDSAHKWTRGSRNNNRRRDYEPKREHGLQWMHKPPGKNEPSTKTVDKKVWHWCSNDTGAPTTGGCNKWVIHKPATCEGRSFLARKRKADNKPVAEANDARKTKRAKKELQVKAATLALSKATIAEAESSSDENSDHGSVMFDSDRSTTSEE